MHKLILYLSILVLASCGGGGGGGDGGSSEGARLFQGAILLPPQSFLVESDAVEFASIGDYRKFDKDAPLLSVAGSEILLDSEARKQTVLLYGNSRAKVIAHGFEKDDQNNAGIRLVHAVDQTSLLRMLVNGESRTTVFGEAGSYVELLPGEHIVQVLAEGSGQIFDAVLNLEPSQDYSLYVTGQAGLFTKAVLVED